MYLHWLALRLFRRATADQLAARGKTKSLVGRIQPKATDLVEMPEGGLGDIRYERRAAACRALADVGGDDVTQALMARLTDPVADLRVEATRSLLARDGDHLELLVPSVLAWAEEAARAQAADLIADHTQRDTADAESMLHAYVHADAAPDRTFTEDWVAAVFDSVQGPARAKIVGEAADAALAGADAPRATQVVRVDRPMGASALVEHLQREASRVPAAILLGTLRDARATLPLVETLDDPDPEARRAAAEALGLIKDPLAVAPLLRRSVDPVYEVRNAAQRALDEMGTAGVVWSVSAAAHGALEAAEVPTAIEPGEPDAEADEPELEDQAGTG